MEELNRSLVDYIKFQQEQNQVQQETMMKSQQEFLQQLTTVFGAGNQQPPAAVDAEFRMENLNQNITEFDFIPESNITFEAWYVHTVRKSFYRRRCKYI